VASRQGALADVEVLVAAGANVNLAGDISNTPLHEAASQGHLEVVKKLLASGANPLATNEYNETARKWARRYPEVEELLRQTEEQAQRLDHLGQ